MDRSLKDSYVRWLEGMRWDWWVTPTFRYPKTQPEAVEAVRQWLSSRAPHVYAFVAYEQGPQGGRLHVHAVIGGIGQHPLLLTHLKETWRRGILDVKPYDPTLRGIRYMLDRADDPDAVELIGSPVSFRPRRRRR